MSTTNQRKSRPRTPIQLAGSFISRGAAPAAQQRPSDTGRFGRGPITFAGPDPRKYSDPRLDFHKAFGDTDPEPPEQRTLDDVFPVAFPKCIHGIQITCKERAFQSLYKRKYHSLTSLPISFECIRCHSVCKHGLSLTEAEVKTGKRYSADCPECTGRFTGLQNTNRLLHSQKMGTKWGSALVEGELVTSYGLRITKCDKNVSLFGGANEVEKADADYVAVREDGCNDEVVAMPTGGPERNGYGPDGNSYDEGWAVNGLGDPVSGRSKFIEYAETMKGSAIVDSIEAAVMEKSEAKNASPEIESETRVETIVPESEPAKMPEPKASRVFSSRETEKLTDEILTELK